jgi:regulator of protease activity HflC (stomatin/prohibitin superfamily)
MPRIITPNHRLVEDIVAAENAKRAERQRQAQAQAEAAERERQAREQAEAAERERQQESHKMKRIIVAITFALMLASPAQSNEQAPTFADGAALVLAYNHHCERMPLTMVRMAERAMQQIPEHVMNAAMDRVFESYRMVGLVLFCKMAKSILETP